MSARTKVNKGKRKYWIDMLSAFVFIQLIVSGILLMPYHAGHELSEKLFICNGHQWLLFHKIISIPSFFLIVIHLWQHKSWFTKLFSGKLVNRHKKMNLSLMLIFTITLITAFLSWLFINDVNAAAPLRGLHSKFGILLIVFLIIHLIQYSRFLIVTTREIRKKR